MKIWLLTDTHFGHKKMEQYGRPTGWEHELTHTLSIQNRQIANNKDENILIHLGDVCMGMDDVYNYRLTKNFPGNKWLVLGNHDKKSVNWYIVHGWDWVGEDLSLSAYGFHIVFSHEPKDALGIRGLKLHSGIREINIHGHLHGNGHRIQEYKSYSAGYNLPFSLEKDGYKMIELKSFLEKHA